jgi:hypothetical protein
MAIGLPRDCLETQHYVSMSYEAKEQISHPIFQLPVESIQLAVEN